MVKFLYGGAILDKLEFYKTISSYIAIAITFLGFYLSHKSKSLSTYEKQLSEVYGPLFMVFEPHLYKQISLETANHLSISLDSTIEKHYVLCHPVLIERASTFHEVIISNLDYQLVFKDICLHIDRYYDKLRKNINLPVRNMTYRFYKKQFSDKRYAWLYIFCIVIYAILRFLFALLVILILLGAVSGLLKTLLEPLSML